MLAILLEITSTLVCWACIPVPAISSERICLFPLYQALDVRCWLAALWQQLVDRRLLPVGLGLDELGHELELPQVIHHARRLEHGLDVGILDRPLHQGRRGDRCTGLTAVSSNAPPLLSATVPSGIRPKRPSRVRRGPRGVLTVKYPLPVMARSNGLPVWVNVPGCWSRHVARSCV